MHRQAPAVPRLPAQPGQRGQPVLVLVAERVEQAAGAEAAPAALQEDLETPPANARPKASPNTPRLPYGERTRTVGGRTAPTGT